MIRSPWHFAATIGAGAGTGPGSYLYDEVAVDVPAMSFPQIG